MKSIYTIILIFLFGVQGFTQVSQGGSPIEFPRLKKLSNKVLVDLPHLNNDRLLRKSLIQHSDKKLKSLKFAESIPVCLNTSNSGEWIEYDDHKIWTLEIRSEGAKSLNLIFDEYELPYDSRLFIYTPDKNDLIGAFTSENNKSTGILATEPVYGDHIILQYEEPLDADFETKLSIGEVNHDFIGIVDSKVERRPLRLAGECHVNINCDEVEDYKDVSNGIVRIIIAGDEICSGTLLNNTKKDGTPYIYTAGHCIENAAQAIESVFLFNYESPYCEDINGDASHSLSGSTLRARADSLDFALVEMSIEPPAAYRPYYVGWDRREILPESSVCIHHPQGVIKKIAIDDDSPKIKSYSEDYISNAFFLIGNWEAGTTEGGSSGAALINQDEYFIGSLTGGSASCDNSVRDYFSSFYTAWDYFDDPSKRLKDWLDPESSNLNSINGFVFEHDIDLCGAYTNFGDNDVHENIEILESGQSKGYWAGINNYGYNNFAEKFEQEAGSDVIGVSVGIGIAAKHSASANSKIKLQVYNGSSQPEDLVHEQEYGFINIDPGVMNYFEFDKRVSVEKDFFIVFSTDQLDSEDSVSVYLAKREIPKNSFYLKDGNEWYAYSDKTLEPAGSALLMEVVLCNIGSNSGGSDLKSAELPFIAYPNPISGTKSFYFDFKEKIITERIAIYDLAGHLIVEQDRGSYPTDKIDLDFTGFKTGTYIVRVLSNKETYQTKVLYIEN